MVSNHTRERCLVMIFKPNAPPPSASSTSQIPEKVHHRAAGENGQRSQLHYSQFSRPGLPDYQSPYAFPPEHTAKRHKGYAKGRTPDILTSQTLNPSPFNTIGANDVNRRPASYEKNAKPIPKYPAQYPPPANFQQQSPGYSTGLFTSPYQQDRSVLTPCGTASDRVDAVKQEAPGNTNQHISCQPHSPLHADPFGNEMAQGMAAENNGHLPRPTLPFEMLIVDTLPPDYFDNSPEMEELLATPDILQYSRLFESMGDESSATRYNIFGTPQKDVVVKGLEQTLDKPTLPFTPPISQKPSTPQGGRERLVPTAQLLYKTPKREIVKQESPEIKDSFEEEFSDSDDKKLLGCIEDHEDDFENGLGERGLKMGASMPDHESQVISDGESEGGVEVRGGEESEASSHTLCVESDLEDH
jgi:hypothetical protein